MVQCYSTGDTTCPPMRPLANTIELVHPSAYSSPQPKRQMDRFRRFCTACGTKCLYFTMDALIHQNFPFPPGIWTSHVTHDALGPCEPTTETSPRSVQPCLPVSASKLFLPMLASGFHVIHGSLGPPESGTQMPT